MSTPPASPVKVLVVEDSRLMQDHLVTLLDGIAGLAPIDIRETAESAIAFIATMEPDLVILDVSLRTGSGLDVLRAIKRGGLTSAVIIFTSYDTEIFRSRCLAAGADWFVSKTNELGRLERLLRSIAQNGIEASR